MKFCKNACHVSQFEHKLLYRKEAQVLQHFQVNGLYEKYEELKELYKSEEFTKIDLKWGKRINELRRYFDAMLEASKNGNLSDIKDTLARYFDFTNVQQTPEQLKIAKKIDDLLFLQEANRDILKYIDMPYHIEDESSTSKLFDILKKVMVL
jgi:hypothetical protein